MTTLIRATALRDYEALARSLGVDTGRALHGVGLSGKVLADADGLISYNAMIRLLENTAAEAGCPAFGLRLARQHGVGSLGVLAILIRHAPTVGEAVSLAARYLFVHSPALRLEMLPVEGQHGLIDLSLAIDMPHLPPHAQAVELALGVAQQALRLLAGAAFRPRLVQFPHARLGSAADYAGAFGCECRFQAPIAALRVARADLQRPTPEHDPTLRGLAENYLRQNFGAPTQFFADRVRAAVRRFLGEGHALQANVASALAVHPRTLQRRLQAEGHAFGDILAEVRRERLRELLAGTPGMSLAHVAMILGYADQAALTRSCRRWFGRTPSELREDRAWLEPPGDTSDTTKPR